MGVGGQLEVPAALRPAKRAGTHCTGGRAECLHGSIICADETFLSLNPPHLLRTPKIHQSTHKILSEGPILSHLKPVYTHIHSLTRARTHTHTHVH